MARLLSAPWPSFLSRKPLPAAPSTPKAAPSVAQVLSSRAARWIATAAVSSLLFLAVFHNRHGISSFSLRGAYYTQHDAAGSEETPVAPSNPLGHVDWSQYAYIQYVTNSHYLCNSVMIFETLHRLGSLADRVMMYPARMFDPAATEAKTGNAKLIMKARDEYNVKLMPITVQNRPMQDCEVPLLPHPSLPGETLLTQPG